MKRLLQSFLLQLYALITRSGLLSLPWTQHMFLKFYELYKILIEAGEIESLKDYIKPNEVVIDIGANIGFFTKRFAKWVNGTGFVIAVEPEVINYKHLLRSIEKTGLNSVVKPVQGVAAEKDGMMKLGINPTHPGDHKIAEEGVDVQSFAIDTLVETNQAQRICLIKIDVQGAEERVLEGAQKTIERDHPAIFIELDDEALKKMGSNGERVINWILDRKYRIIKLTKNSTGITISKSEALQLCQKGKYTDLLFI
jgi:FkbM family methyltransferase